MSIKNQLPHEIKLLAAQLAGGVSHIAREGDKAVFPRDEVWFYNSYGYTTGLLLGLTALGLDTSTLRLLKNDLWGAILHKDWPRAVKLFEAIRLWANGVANEIICP